MTTQPVSMDDLHSLVQGWDQGAWCLAALALSVGNLVPDEQASAAGAVLAALGLEDVASRAGDGRLVPAERLAGQAKAPLLQIATMLSGGSTWMEQTDDGLIAQGRTSAQMAPAFTQFILPTMPGLADRLAAPGARMLDVGVGVAAMAVAFAEVLPKLTVVGLDVLPKALRLAAQTVADSSVTDRVILREQDVATLDEQDCYDLVWLPAPFLPTSALHPALPRVARALKPGGWVMIGHGKFGDDALQDAVNRLKTVAYGGTALDATQAMAMLADAGLTAIRTLPTPPGAPAITVGQRSV